MIVLILLFDKLSSLSLSLLCPQNPSPQNSEKRLNLMNSSSLVRSGLDLLNSSFSFIALKASLE
jgi:hypothetical protein